MGERRRGRGGRSKEQRYLEVLHSCINDKTGNYYISIILTKKEKKTKRGGKKGSKNAFT